MRRPLFQCVGLYSQWRRQALGGTNHTESNVKVCAALRPKWHEEINIGSRKVLLEVGACARVPIDSVTTCRAIAGRTARCRCKFRYVSNFTQQHRAVSLPQHGFLV